MQALFLLITLLISATSMAAAPRCSSVFLRKKNIEKIKIPTTSEATQALDRLDWRRKPEGYVSPHDNFEWVPRREGMNIFGSYVCSGPGCGTRNSAQRDDDGRLYCTNCGKPHQNEVFDKIFFKNIIGGREHIRSTDIRRPGPKNPLVQCRNPDCGGSNLEFVAIETFPARESCVYCDSPLGNSAGERRLLLHHTGPGGVNLNDSLIPVPEGVGWEIHRNFMRDRNNRIALNIARAELIKAYDLPPDMTLAEIDQLLLDIFARHQEQLILDGYVDGEALQKLFEPQLDELLSKVNTYSVDSKGNAAVQTPATKKQSSIEQAGINSSTAIDSVSTRLQVFDQNGKAINDPKLIRGLDRARAEINSRLAIIAGSIVLLAGSGTAYWGYQPVVYEGVVVAIDGANLVIEFQDGDEKFKVSSKYDVESDLRVAVGDRVWLHARKFIGKHQGLEFESGGYYQHAPR